MSLGKQIHLTERLALRYEAQFSNLFNLTNLDIPNTRFANSGKPSGSFGRVTATQPVDQAGPRTIQMALRLLF